MKHLIEMGEISYYKRYVDDTLIIFDQNETNENSVMNNMNSIHKYVEFKLTVEENNNINYLDLTIHRNNNNLSLKIYRKPTQTDFTIISHPTIH
jgi:hypothetical protein